MPRIGIFNDDGAKSVSVKIEVDADLREWREDYGIRLPAHLIRRLGLTPGSCVRVTLEGEPDHNDPEALPSWEFGGTYDIDGIINERND